MRIQFGSSQSYASQKQLEKALDQLTEASLKLSTLKRVNRGSDDPAAMIAAEQLLSELRAAEATSAAAERSRGLVHVADSGLEQATALVGDIRGNILTAENGTTSPAEREALQIEIDAALDALDRIGASSRYAGRPVLDGSAVRLAVSPEGETETLELVAVRSGALGGGGGGRLSDLRTGGPASLSGDRELAVQILDAAQQELVETRARAGAFERYAIDTAQSLADSQISELSQSLGRVEDANVAAESVNLARSVILADTAMWAFKFTDSARAAAADALDDLFDRIA